MGLRLDLHQASHGFFGQKTAHMGEVAAVADPESVEVMMCSPTINWVGQICWSLGLAGGKTESSSSCGKLA